MVERENLELSVRNFGPIARADIDLRPFTVFVGPSNTGKSYLAILIYALHRFVNEHLYRGYISTPDYPPMSSYLTAENIKELERWLETGALQLGSEPISSESIRLLVPDSISESIRPFIRYIGGYSRALVREIERSFGVEDIGKLIRHPSKSGANISFIKRIPGRPEPIESARHRLDIGRRTSKLTASINDTVPLFSEWNRDGSIRALINYIRLSLEDPASNLDELILMSGLATSVKYWLHNPLDYRAHYLPSDRAGVMHAHRVAVGSLIQLAPYAGLQREDPLPLLSGVLADFLQQLSELDLPRRSGLTRRNRLTRRSRPIRRYQSNADHAERIEREMMSGSVRYENSVTGYPSFLYRPEGWKEEIPMMNTSSMVSELAPVALYLRHVVHPGETLIIEEPESHLHPAMQVEFTRQLAAVAKEGVRVIITTHSEWVLDELTNLVRLSELPESRREGIGGADYALSPEELGVWLFEPKNRPRGSVVKEIPFEEDFGGFRSGFDEVAMGTYNDYATISNRVEEGKSG